MSDVKKTPKSATNYKARKRVHLTGDAKKWYKQYETVSLILGVILSVVSFIPEAINMLGLDKAEQHWLHYIVIGLMVFSILARQVIQKSLNGLNNAKSTLLEFGDVDQAKEQAGAFGTVDLSHMSQTDLKAFASKLVEENDHGNALNLIDEVNDAVRQAKKQYPSPTSTTNHDNDNVTTPKPGGAK